MTGSEMVFKAVKGRSRVDDAIPWERLPRAAPRSTGLDDHRRRLSSVFRVREPLTLLERLAVKDAPSP